MLSTSAPDKLDDAILDQVLQRWKQELAMANLATREHFRQQLEAERIERLSAMEEFQENFTSVRDEIRSLQVRQDHFSKLFANQRKDLETQLASLKDSLQSNANVFASTAARVETAEATISELRRDRDHSLVQGIADECRACFDAMQGDLKKEVEELVMKQAPAASEDSISQGLLEMKIFEIMNPIQAHMVEVTEDLKGLGRWREDLEAVQLNLDFLREAAVTQDVLESKVKECLSSMEIMKDPVAKDGDTGSALNDSYKLTLEQSPPSRIECKLNQTMDDEKITALTTQTLEIQQSLGQVQLMNIKLSEFVNDLHTAFDGFRVESGRRLDIIEGGQKTDNSLNNGNMSSASLEEPKVRMARAQSSDGALSGSCTLPTPGTTVVVDSIRRESSLQSQQLLRSPSATGSVASANTPMVQFVPPSPIVAAPQAAARQRTVSPVRSTVLASPPAAHRVTDPSLVAGYSSRGSLNAAVTHTVRMPLTARGPRSHSPRGHPGTVISQVIRNAPVVTKSSAIAHYSHVHHQQQGNGSLLVPVRKASHIEESPKPVQSPQAAAYRGSLSAEKSISKTPGRLDTAASF